MQKIRYSFLLILLVGLMPILDGRTQEVQNSNFPSQSKPMATQNNIIDENSYPFTINASDFNVIYKFSINKPGDTLSIDCRNVSSTSVDLYFEVYLSIQDASNQINSIGSAGCIGDSFGGRTQPILPNANGGTVSSDYYARIQLGARSYYPNYYDTLSVNYNSFTLIDQQKSLNTTKQVYGSFVYEYKIFPNNTYFQSGDSITIQLKLLDENYANQLSYVYWADNSYIGEGIVDTNNLFASSTYTFYNQTATMVEIFLFSGPFFGSATYYSTFNLVYYSSTHPLPFTPTVTATIIQKDYSTIAQTTVTTTITKTKSLDGLSTLLVFVGLATILTRKKLKKRNKLN